MILQKKRLKRLKQGVIYRVSPWQMCVVAKLLRLMPNALFDQAFARRSRKPRGTDG